MCYPGFWTIKQEILKKKKKLKRKKSFSGKMVDIKFAQMVDVCNKMEKLRINYVIIKNKKKRMRKGKKNQTEMPETDIKLTMIKCNIGTLIITWHR